MTRSISRWRPMTGSSLRSRAACVRFRPNWSRMVEPDAARLPSTARRRPLELPAGLLVGLRAGEELNDRLADLRQVGAELLEDLSGYPFAFADQAEENVLGADVVVAELQGFAQARARGPSWRAA